LGKRATLSEAYLGKSSSPGLSGLTRPDEKFYFPGKTWRIEEGGRGQGENIIVSPSKVNHLNHGKTTSIYVDPDIDQLENTLDCIAQNGPFTKRLMRGSEGYKEPGSW